MKNRFLLIGTAGLFVLSSCTGKPEYAPPVFPKEKELQSIRLSPEELMLSYPYDMCVDDNYIYILSSVENTWIQVYDKTDERFIGGYIAGGQGPGEIVMGTSFSYDEENSIISVFDNATGKLLSYKTGGADGELVSFIHEKDFNGQPETRVSDAWELSAGKYLASIGLGGNDREPVRFQLLNNNQPADEYSQFPIEPADERMVFFYNQSVAVSPDCKRMATATLFGGILEIFDLSDDVLTEVATRHFYPPIVRYESGSVRNTSNTIFGFPHLYATNDYIYSVLIGGKDPNLFDNIAVFDWNGNEVVKYHTDCLVYRLYLSAKEPGKLYAIAYSMEEGFYLVYFQLN